MHLFVVLIPVVLPLVLLLVVKMPARLAMAISALATMLAAVQVWGVEAMVIAASSLQGAHRALTILWILIGAITLLKVVQATGALDRIRQGFIHISSDMRVQTVIIGFAFLSLLEGVSGFGTPAVVVAPLLIALGFRPIVAVCIALVSDTVACTFGAVGTPLLVGLENTSSYSPQFISDIARHITLFDAVIATCMPGLLMYMLVVWFGDGRQQKRWRDWRAVMPWALLVGASYSVAATATARYIGVEFAAIIASLVALAVSIVTARFGILLPQSVRWRSKHAYHQHAGVRRSIKMPLWKAWLPYALVVLVLLVSRTVPAVTTWLTQLLDASWRHILGYETISSVWPILHSPGTLLLLVAGVTVVVQGGSWRTMGAASGQALRMAGGAALVLVPTLIMVQIFTNSGINTANMVAMPAYIGTTFAVFLGQGWMVIVPLFGALGAFVAGSATVSNLTLASVQESIAYSAQLPVILVLAMQTLGAVAGNAVAVHNVVAVSAVTGLAGHEGAVIRRVVPIVVLYLAVIVLIGVGYWLFYL